jgi:hypothetical protein
LIRLIAILIASLSIAPVALAQEADPDTDETLQDAAVEAEAEAVAVAESEEEPEEEPVDFDETGLDEQGFADEDDDFDPTETIPTDQSIDFPVDI